MNNPIVKLYDGAQREEWFYNTYYSELGTRNNMTDLPTYQNNIKVNKSIGFFVLL